VTTRRPAFDLPSLPPFLWVLTPFLVAATSALFMSSCLFRKPSTRDVPQSSVMAVTPLKVDANDRSCGGFPAAPIETIPSVCMGLVYQSKSSAFQPRAIIEIPGKDGQFLVTDFAGWSLTAGKIWLLDASQGAGSISMTVFLDGLSIVHQIALGPNQRIYFSEDSKISSFPLSLAQQGKQIQRAQTSVALDNLPPMMRGTTKNSMHPIKHFVFDQSGNLLVNIGAYTDHCNDFKGRRCDETDTAIGAGTSSNVQDHGAVIRQYNYLGSPEKGWDPNHRIIAQGLRNSMGMLVTKAGDLLQVENGRDFNDSARPYEEINLIPKQVLAGASPPRHYGWPYCYNHDETSEEWMSFSFSCQPGANYEAPFSLLPPHSAPLGMMIYTGKLLPELTNTLIVPLHGYRPAGHRILAFALDPTSDLPKRQLGGVYFVDDLSGDQLNLQRTYPDQASVSPAIEVVSGWYDAPGVRGKGAPVAITQGRDGAIWIADDKNNAVLRLAAPSAGFKRQEPPPRPNFARAFSDLIKESPAWMASYQKLRTQVLQSTQCSGCHDDYRNPGDSDADGLAALRYIASFGNWVVPKDTTKSVLAEKLSPPGNSSMPPKDKPFASLTDAQAALQITSDFINEMPQLKDIMLVKPGATPTLIGLKRGQSGNRDCGILKPGQALWALGSTPQQLRGVPVRSIKIASTSTLVDWGQCAGDDTFFVADGDLKPFVQ
jgi:glucose/arabinose dehydrogenase